MKKWIVSILILLCLIFLVCVPTIAASPIQITLKSFDYSDNIFFGRDYHPSVDREYLGSENEIADQQSYTHNIDSERTNCIKVWLRFELFLSEDYFVDSSIVCPQDISISNVHVFSSTSNIRFHSSELLPASNAIPRNCSLDSMDHSLDDWDEYWQIVSPNQTISAKFEPTKYWSQDFDNEITEWIGEIVIEDGDQSFEEICNLVASLSVECDVTILSSSGCVSEHLCVNNQGVEHIRRYDQTTIDFSASSFSIESFETEKDKLDFLSASSNSLICATEESYSDFYKNPEQYTLVSLNITMLKQMPWAVCNVEFSLIPNEYFVGIFITSDETCFLRDRWKNGYYALYPICLVVKSSNIHDQDIGNELKEVNLSVAFSTEFAGKNDFSRTESIGFPGIRFIKPVFMEEITTTNEILERLGNICDG